MPQTAISNLSHGERKQVGNPLQINNIRRYIGKVKREKFSFLRYSEERIWLAKYTILQIASLGVTPNTPKEIFRDIIQTLDNTVIARYNRLT